MDVIPSSGPDHTIVLEAQSLVETSNDRSDVESPVLGLATELTMLIFRLCSSKIEDRVLVTHICRRWRQIAVNDASLWTDVYIQTKYRKQNARLGHFLSFLGMQLDRTADLLLDVIWSAQGGDEFFVATLQLVREKAPFSRWRALTVDISGGSHDDAPWSAAGEFTNLESLVVWTSADSSVGNPIDHTVTSRLKVLQVTRDYVTPAEIARCFAKTLTHISTLRLQSFRFIPPGPFLPANVVNLELDSGWQHPFPHIRTYKIGVCFFTGRDSIDLRSMTTLIVSDNLQINPDAQVSLLALQELTLGTLVMDTSSIFEAPALDSLHFTKIRFKNMSRLKYTNVTLLQKGYLLSPNISITTDSYMPSTALIGLLSRSPKVTRATLRFDDWVGAQVVLARLLGFKMENDSYPSENEILCPRLFEIRLDFGWDLSEPSGSEEWLLNALESRRSDGCMAPLSIYVSWKGERTYVLLRGGC